MALGCFLLWGFVMEFGGMQRLEVFMTGKQSYPYRGKALAHRLCSLPNERPQEPRQVGAGSAVPALPSTGLKGRRARGTSGE